MHFLKRSLPSTGTAARIAFGAVALWLGASLHAVSQVLPPAASAGEATVTRELPKVAPYEFNGDLSKVPAMPAGRSRPLVYRPKMPEPPFTKQPGATAATPSAPQVSAVPQAPMPSPTQNFAGLNLNDACTGGLCGSGWPTDVNGDVGPNHYIQSVNSSYAIYNKTGTRLAAFTEDALWSGVGSTPCNGSSAGDPVVLYDWLADRWILTHFAFNFDGSFNPTTPFYQCIAASMTSDPVAGGWWLYAVRMDPGGTGRPPVGAINDYGKFGLWHDCLYMAANEFQMPAGSYAGVAVASFSRADLYSGAALTASIGFLSYPSNNIFTLIPSNNQGRGSYAVQPGTPNYFVSESQSLFAFEVRKFTAGPNCGAGGTLSAPTNVNQTSYDYTTASNVPQPNTATGLDPLFDRLMQKVQYRKVGTAESLWVVHSVRVLPATSTIRPQWAQIDVTAGTVATTPVQQQIYAPDTTLNRWMSSLAVDNQGNMALGYSTSNGTAPNFPSIAYSGRLAGDPLGTLPQTETQMIAGAGSQIFNCGGAPCDRWGDYTSMSVDPSDDCTFWYTNQYYSSQANGSSGNWQTRIGSFKFAQCVPIPPPVFRAYLSGHGSDSNPCTLLLPCRLLPRAIDAVANDGEVWMLDSANYNLAPVSVNKSVAILAVPGAIGSVVAFGGSAGAIVINASAVTVSLRNVVVVPYPGVGVADGIVMTAPSTLAIENSLIANLSGQGVNVTGVGKLKISDSIIRNNTGFAVLVANGVAAEISGTQMLGNGGGGVLAQSTTATSTTASVSDCFISGQVVGDAGVQVSTTVASAVARIFVTRCAIEGVDRAVKSVTNGNGSASIALSDSMIANNAFAWELSGTGSIIRSLGNNHITDNGTAAGVLTLTPLQ